ncbi:hypothetical protein F3N42_08925 [Marinihelvus fidelis]|uniref:Uncharacterized protein n=1 Tax=Marinihelvus fidelis TaxID=2613842 RepID=A0A5N0T915_9GAMM|nr:hypothetical protein F3N42_08925 [Marinihelvus fidelis]
MIALNVFGVIALLHAWRKPGGENRWVDPVLMEDQVASQRRQLKRFRLLLLCGGFFMAGLFVGGQALPDLFIIGMWVFLLVQYGYMRITLNRLEGLRVRATTRPLT